ncbi:Hypothetical_protein [Hexamita inflata]|uniref:Hypothetical_protein n=1 Tax=Hexamita inflata TaxID=28002 RepID=A0AA86QV30_9EUKA|nr:Hypothetical protein HINF_LOCUS48952 [Hexamita inflata]
MIDELLDQVFQSTDILKLDEFMLPISRATRRIELQQYQIQRLNLFESILRLTHIVKCTCKFLSRKPQDINLEILRSLLVQQELCFEQLVDNELVNETPLYQSLMLKHEQLKLAPEYIQQSLDGITDNDQLVIDAVERYEIKFE